MKRGALAVVALFALAAWWFLRRRPAAPDAVATSAAPSVAAPTVDHLAALVARVFTPQPIPASALPEPAPSALTVAPASEYVASIAPGEPAPGAPRSIFDVLGPASYGVPFTGWIQ